MCASCARGGRRCNGSARGPAGVRWSACGSASGDETTSTKATKPYAKVSFVESMKKTVFLFCALATAVAVAQARLTPEQALDRRTIGDRAGGDLAFSPDGTRLVFTVAEPVNGTARARAIWMLDVTSGQSRQLTFSGKNDASPRWAPEGAGSPAVPPAPWSRRP